MLPKPNRSLNGSKNPNHNSAAIHCFCRGKLRLLSLNSSRSTLVMTHHQLLHQSFSFGDHLSELCDNVQVFWSAFPVSELLLRPLQPERAQGESSGFYQQGQQKKRINTTGSHTHICDSQYLQSGDLVLEDLLGLVEVPQQDLYFSVVDYTYFPQIPIVSL